MNTHLDRKSPDSNLFYLPRDLPEKIYFILTRRPFVRERSRLLLEAPSQVLDLGDYPEQNREDIQAYIRQYLTPLTPLAKGGTEEIPSTSLIKGGTEEESGDRTSPPFLRGAGGDLNQFKERLIQQLTAQSENNFMYLSHILDALAQGFYPEPLQFDRLPPSLEAYYHNHWQRMAQLANLTPSPPLPHQGMGESGSPLRSLSVPKCAGERQGQRSIPLAVLHILIQHEQPLSAAEIAQLIDEDDYDVEEVLENWVEFLQQQQIDGEIRYRLYHSSFRHFLKSTAYP